MSISNEPKPIKPFIGSRVKTITDVNGIPAGTTGVIIDEMELYDYQVKFDVPLVKNVTEDNRYETYAFHSHKLEFITRQENSNPPRRLCGLTLKDLIAYYCQEMQITPEELIANFGNDEHNINIMHQDTTNGRNKARVTVEDGVIVIEGA